MTHCDFSVRSARDEMRHIIGSSESDVLICELYGAQTACGVYFVHEPTSEVNSRMNRHMGTNRNMGTSSCPSSGRTVERGPEGAEDAGTEEESRRCKEDTRDCS